MMAHSCNPSTWKTEAGEYYEFKANLGYIVSSRLPWAIHKTLCQKIN